MTERTLYLGAYASRHRLMAFASLVVPALALPSLAIFHSYAKFESIYAILFFVGWLATMTGVSVGFHRLFTHKSFEAVSWITYFLAILGSMAAQGPLSFWVATHRRHHAHTDQPDDPHSPSIIALPNQPFLKRLFHAHAGWLFDTSIANPVYYAKDILADPVLSFISRNYNVIAISSVILPAAIGYLLTWSLMVGVGSFLWGGLLRVLTTTHLTWCINSLCHARLDSHTRSLSDSSRNIPILALFTFGESWHHEHHVNPRSAAFAAPWYKCDLGYQLIRFLRLIGLANKVRYEGRG